MFINTTRALCVSLVLANVVTSRAVAPRGFLCSGEDCDINDIVARTHAPGWTDLSYASLIDKKSPLPSAETSPRHVSHPRAVVPIIRPEPEPEPISPEESEPGSDPLLAPESPNSNDGGDSTVNLCTRGTFGSIRRSECHPGISGDETNDGGGFGEDELDVTANKPEEPEPPTVDFFEVARGPNPPENPAKSFFEHKIRSQEPDMDLPTIDKVDKFYEVKPPKPLAHVAAGVAGRGAFQELLEHVGIDYEPAGQYFEIEAKAASIEQLPFHETTLSNDGKLAFADFSGKDLDHTAPENRMPWFRALMHLRTQRLQGKPDPRELRAIARVNIYNPNTMKAIDSIFETLKPVPGKTFIEVKADAPAGTDEAAAFDAFMRSDNGRGIYWLLGNYHTAFGDKTITQLVLRKGDLNAKPRRPAAALVVLSEN